MWPLRPWPGPSGIWPPPQANRCRMLTAVKLRPACGISLTAWFPGDCNYMPFWASKQAVSGCETACFEAQNGLFRNAMRQPLHCAMRRLTLLNAAGWQSARVPPARLWLRAGAAATPAPRHGLWPAACLWRVAGGPLHFRRLCVGRLLAARRASQSPRPQGGRQAACQRA